MSTLHRRTYLGARCSGEAGSIYGIVWCVIIAARRQTAESVCRLSSPKTPKDTEHGHRVAHNASWIMHHAQPPKRPTRIGAPPHARYVSLAYLEAPTPPEKVLGHYKYSQNVVSKLASHQVTTRSSSISPARGGSHFHHHRRSGCPRHIAPLSSSSCFSYSSSSSSSSAAATPRDRGQRARVLHQPR